MEHRFDFDEERPRVVITLSGCLTVDAVRGYQLALYSHPRWHPGIDAVVDMRGVEVGDFSSEEIRTSPAPRGPIPRFATTAASRRSSAPTPPSSASSACSTATSQSTTAW